MAATQTPVTRKVKIRVVVTAEIELPGKTGDTMDEMNAALSVGKVNLFGMENVKAVADPEITEILDVYA